MKRSHILKWREMSKGNGESETAAVAPVHISGEDFSFPQIITDLQVEAVLRWLCGGKGFDQTPRQGCLDRALVMTGRDVIQQRGLRGDACSPSTLGKSP